MNEGQENMISKVCEGVCPVCGEDVEYGSTDIGDGVVFYDVECPVCGFQGHEIYDLIYHHTEWVK